MPRKKKTSDRFIVALVSDMHSGHQLALLNPQTELYDETPMGDIVPYRPQPSASQKYLWELYTNCIQQTVDLAGGDNIYLVSLGDETQGDKHKDQLVSDRITDQFIIAADNLDPWFGLKNLKMVRLTAGTGAHSFVLGGSTVAVSSLLKNKYPKHDIKMAYHGLIEIDGFTLDYSHHGPHPGSRAWLKGNTARFYLRDLMMRAFMQGLVPPKLIARGHYHTPVMETLEVNGYESKLMILPSLTMMNEHARQATRSAHEISNGTAAVEVIRGELHKIHMFTQTLDIRTKEVIKNG